MEYYLSLCCPEEYPPVFAQSLADAWNGKITSCIPWIEGPEGVSTDMFEIYVPAPPYAQLAQLFEDGKIFVYSVHHAEEKRR